MDLNNRGGEHLVGDLLWVEVGAPGWYSDHRPTQLLQVAISRVCLSLGPPSRIAVGEFIDLDVDAATVPADEGGLRAVGRTRQHSPDPSPDGSPWGSGT
jgi:hypothetical protein